MRRFNFKSAIVASIIAVIVMTIFMMYFGMNIMKGLGYAAGVSGVWATILGAIIHLVIGVIYGIVYALIFDPLLQKMPGFLRGCIFSILPFILSATLMPQFLNLVGTIFGVKKDMQKEAYHSQANAYGVSKVPNAFMTQTILVKSNGNCKADYPNPTPSGTHGSACPPKSNVMICGASIPISGSNSPSSKPKTNPCSIHGSASDPRSNVIICGACIPISGSNSPASNPKTNPCGTHESASDPRSNVMICGACIPIPGSNSPSSNPKTSSGVIKDAPPHPRCAPCASEVPMKDGKCMSYHAKINSCGMSGSMMAPRSLDKCSIHLSGEEDKSPLLWNFLNHLVYGFVLGLLYFPKKRKVSVDESL